MSGIRIPPNVFDCGLSIGHIGPIIVNKYAKVGKNCRIHVGVTIGAGDKNEEGFLPVIGDNVYIGPGAVIYGEIRIASNCRIGANSVVNKSFTDEWCLIAGIPAVIKKKSEDNKANAE